MELLLNRLQDISIDHPADGRDKHLRQVGMSMSRGDVSRPLAVCKPQRPPSATINDLPRDLHGRAAVGDLVQRRKP
jgi:hypothetical protein